VAYPGHFRFDSTDAENPWTFPACSRPELELCCDRLTRVTTLRDDQRIVRQWSDPLEALHWLEYSAKNQLNARSRYVGFLSYDVGRLFESIPVTALDDLSLPLFRFCLVTPTTSRDSIDSLLPTPAEASSRLTESAHHVSSASNVSSTFTRSAYLHAVARCIHYIHAGDIFQVNLSQRFSTHATRSARAIYENLQRSAPASYAALLDFADLALICNSPELFLSVDAQRTVTTRPIKGTRPNRPGRDVELLHSEKDTAELNMIIDLERNDLGRVCEIGSVKVTQPRTIETHPTVFHGVATVEGKLRPDVRFVDLLRATFPGGSITGAPKVRAMQIIEELEPVCRGPYCGAIGYLAPGGVIQFNVAIRTMIMKDGLVHVPVGGGIVADSVPEEEYEETLVKARAMLMALGIDVDDVRSATSG
jgi:para-aminobenzoate synthetase component 1